MSLYIDTAQPQKIYIDNKLVSAVYIDTQKVWGSTVIELDQNVDDPGEIDYDEFEELL